MAEEGRAVRLDDDLLTAEEVAELLAVKADWIGVMVARNEIPFVLTGTRWLWRNYRFRRSDIEAWMAENRRRESEVNAPELRAEQEAASGDEM